MKKIFLLSIAIFSSALVFAQSAQPAESQEPKKKVNIKEMERSRIEYVNPTIQVDKTKENKEDSGQGTPVKGDLKIQHKIINTENKSKEDSQK